MTNVSNYSSKPHAQHHSTGLKLRNFSPTASRYQYFNLVSWLLQPIQPYGFNNIITAYWHMHLLTYISHSRQVIHGIRNVTTITNCLYQYYSFSNPHTHTASQCNQQKHTMAESKSATDVCHQSITVLDRRLTGREIRPRMSDVALQQQQMLDKVWQCLWTASTHCSVHGTCKYIIWQL